MIFFTNTKFRQFLCLVVCWLIANSMYAQTPKTGDRFNAGNDTNSKKNLQVAAPYIIPASCIICSDGIVDVFYKVLGGNSPYSYQWSNGSTNSYIINVLPGYYSVTVSDASGQHRDIVCYVPVID